MTVGSVPILALHTQASTVAPKKQASAPTSPITPNGNQNSIKLKTATIMKETQPGFAHITFSQIKTFTSSDTLVDSKSTHNINKFV